MKKFFLFAVAAITIAACENKTKTEVETPADNKQEVITVANAAHFEAIGTVKVATPAFEADNDTVRVTILTDTTLRIDLVKMRFADKMPQLDMVIDSVRYIRTADGIEFGEKAIVPKYMDKPFPQYTANDLKGSIDEDEIEFETSFAAFYTTYEGEISKISK